MIGKRIFHSLILGLLYCQVGMAQVDICTPFCPEFCDLVQNPSLSVDAPCPFTLDLGSILSVDVTGDASISCGAEEATVTAQMGFLELTGPVGQTTIQDLIPGPICGLLDGVGITVPLPGPDIDIDVIPSLFPPGIDCNSNLIDLLLAQINDFTGSVSAGQEPGGRLLVADTDGNGSFDFVIEQEMGDPRLDQTTFTVPNNVRGNGCITVRGVNSYPVPPLDVCGLIQVDISLLTLLEPVIGAIPIAGPIIIAVLQDQGCDANLSFSASDDHVINVVSDQPPIFVNCPNVPYVFADDGSCTDPVNWSIPIALDNCTGEVLTFMGIGPVGTDPGVWQTAGPQVGSNLGVGTHTVEYTARGCANTTVCRFDIIVQDNNPLLVCPADITLGTDVEECFRLIQGIVPISGQSCVSQITYESSGATTVPAGTDFTNLQNGVMFNPGVNTIEYTMTVDLNLDGDVTDNINGVDETQTCSFDITIQDNERPFAICNDIDVQLDANGQVTVFASDQVASFIAGSPVVDGGSTDNCTARDDLIIRINNNLESITFDCDDIGVNFVNLSVFDLNHNPDGTFATGARNVRTCVAQINVIDFFDNYVVELDAPEVCFENGVQTIDLAQFLTIRRGDGTLLTHADVLADPTLEGEFVIAAAAPLNGGSAGSVTADGVYTINNATATGNVIFEYFLRLAANDECVVRGRSTFELRQPMLVNDAVCSCPNEDNLREVNLGDFLGNPNGTGGFFPNGEGPFTIQYTGGVLTDGNGTIIDINQNGTVIYDYAYIPGTVIDANGVYWGSGNILDDDATTNDLTDNPSSGTLLPPRNLTGDGNGVFNLGSIIPVDPGLDAMIGTNDDVQLDGNWSFTIIDGRGCEIFRSGSCAPLLSGIQGPSGPICITDPILTYQDARVNTELTGIPRGIPACETVLGGASHDITWELSTSLGSGGIFTLDIATISGGTLPPGFVDVMPDNTPTSILTVFNNGQVELNPINLQNSAFRNGGDFVLRMYVDRHACFDGTDVDNNSSGCSEVFETSFTILPEFNPAFTTPNEPICVQLVDDATTDDGDASNPADNESLITLCLTDFTNIVSLFNTLEPILDRSGQIIEENAYITWSGPGVTDLNDGTIADNDGDNTTTTGPGRTNAAGNASTGCATFNPAIAGEGTHTITVEVGYDNCRRTFAQTIVVKRIESADLVDDYGVCSSQLGQVNLTALFQNTTRGGVFSLVNAYGYGPNTVDNQGRNDGTTTLDDTDLTRDNNRNGLIDVMISGDVLTYDRGVQQTASTFDSPFEICVAYGVGCDFSLLGSDYTRGTADDYTGVAIVASLPTATAPPPNGNYQVVATPTQAAPIFNDTNNDGYISVAEIVTQFTQRNPLSGTYDAPTQSADIDLILNAMAAAQPCFVSDVACFSINNGHEAFLDLPEEILCARGQDSLVQLYRYTAIDDVDLSTLIVEQPNGDLDAGEIQFLLAAVNGQSRLSPTTNPKGFALGTAGLPSLFTVDSDNDGVYTPGIDLDLTAVISTANCDANNRFSPIDPTAPSSDFCPMLDFGVLSSIPDPVNLTIRLQYNNAECINIAEDNILKLYEIPTLSQWGLLLFALLLFNLRLVFAYRQQLVVQGATNISLRVVPFNKVAFIKYFVMLLLVFLLLFLLSNIGFGYQLMPFDIPGSLLTAVLIAYFFQLLNSK